MTNPVRRIVRSSTVWAKATRSGFQHHSNNLVFCKYVVHTISNWNSHYKFVVAEKVVEWRLAASTLCNRTIQFRFTKIFIIAYIFNGISDDYTIAGGRAIPIRVNQMMVSR